MARKHTVLRTIDAYSVLVLSDGETTQVEVNTKTGYGDRVLAIGKGTARRAPGDVHNDGIGELLAIARAFEDAARTARTSLASLGYNNAQG